MVFVWGGSSRGINGEELQILVRAFSGRLNVLLSNKLDALTIPQLRELGVARISVGPRLMFKAIAALKEEAERLLNA